MKNISAIIAVAVLVALSTASTITPGWRVRYRSAFAGPATGLCLAPNGSWCVTKTGTDDIHVVYTAGPHSSSDVYYRRSTDDGRTWETAVNISDMDGGGSGPAWDGVIAGLRLQDTVIVAWYDTSGAGNKPRVYATAWRTDATPKWYSPVLDMTNHAEEDHKWARSPCVAVDYTHYEPRAFVAWTDSCDQWGDGSDRYTVYNKVDLEDMDRYWDFRRVSVDARADLVTVCARYDLPGCLTAWEHTDGDGDKILLYEQSYASNDFSDTIDYSNADECRPCIQRWEVGAPPPRAADDTVYVAYQVYGAETDGEWDVYVAGAEEDRTGDHDDWFRLRPGSDFQTAMGNVRHPNIWCSDDTLFLVCVGSETGSSRRKVYFTISNGVQSIGRDWITPQPITGYDCDSASMFAHGKEAYIVARRHLYSTPATGFLFLTVLKYGETRCDEDVLPRPQARALGSTSSSDGQLLRAMAIDDFVSVDRSDDGGASWEEVFTPGLGGNPALAVDTDSTPCVVFTRDDTVYCSFWNRTNEDWDEPVTVFEGVSTARPGQPSVTLYPGMHDGVKVAGITFPVYYSGASESHILFAKVDSGRVVLDTVIANSISLVESLPSINVDSDSTIYVVWQSDDAIVEKDMDFHPGCWTAHGDTWSTAAVLSAGGNHPSSNVEGSILHAVWREENTGGPTAVRTIKGKSNDFTDSLWSGWQDDGTASESDSCRKDWPGFGGAGVTYWQERVGGVWNILAEVRGDTMTLVATDSNSLYPHAVAESSHISPSISQVRVKLLWAEEIITDTCEYRFKVCSLNVSNAGSDATISNTGRKLLRKDGSDSLFAVYADADNSIMYGRSADGSEWTREEVAADGVFPAVCEDGTGTRWIVYWDREADPSGFIWVRARFDSAGTLSGVRDLYQLTAGDSCGPISLAGSYDDATMCAYAAFRRMPAMDPDQSILLKFGDCDVYSTTLNALGEFECNPCISTEWVAGEPDGDHIHLVWENTDEGEAYYAMTSDPIAADEWSPNITWENSVNLSDTPEDDSRNPVVANDADRIVVAWAERTTSDILVVQRSTDSLYDNFQDTVNVSVSAVTSAYPTIAMGDSMVVVWEERTSGTDYDVYASVELDTGFSIQDNSGKSTYPFAVFENQASGDSAIPYIHLIWSDAPSGNYYEVGYLLYNIKESGTGGQQSGGNIGPMLRPELSACRPNPFASRTQIRYQFPQTGRVLLRVYDASGRVVRTLQNGAQKPGAYTVDWDGADDRGRTVANGIYFYRLDAPGFRDVKKAVLMK